MFRLAARLFLLFVSAVLLPGLSAAARADSGPALTAKFGVAGHYRPGGWCLVTVGVQNPGPDTVSGQIQVRAEGGSANQSPYGRAGRQDASAVVYACPVSVPGGSAAPRFFPLYLRGIDPGQADLTVQLVAGRERGDGRVLASISNQNQSTAPAFSGVPLTAGDTLLVGFGGDPGAFLFLNGRHLGPSAALPTQPLSPNLNGGGLAGGAAAPATVQVAEAATAADLPDRAAGYSGVQAFLLRSDAPIEALTEAQSSALRGWVAGGGHLIVCGGVDPTRFGAAFFDGLLPASVGGSSRAGTLALTPKPLPGVRVVQSAPGGGAQIVSGPYGAGLVTLTAFDPATPAFQSFAGQALPPIWQRLLGSVPALNSSVLAMTAAREENVGAVYYGNSPLLLSEAVMRGPSLDAPGAWTIAVFLLVYLVVLVPVNYFVLKRLDRKELAWLTIPALVFVFAAGTFAVGYAAKGGRVFVNRAALIETRAGQTQAGVYSEIGLFSPHRTTYDLTLPGQNLLAAVPNPGVSYGGGSDSPLSGPAQFVETPGGVSLPGTPVNMWAMRAFDVPSTTDLGGAIDGALADSVGTVRGSVTNHTPYALTDCAVWYAGGWRTVGTLTPGATVTLPISGSGSPQAAFPGPAPGMDSNRGIGDRMHGALADYFRSLSQSTPNYYNGSAPPPAYAPAPGEAVLTGWSRDPKLAGPAPRIDGRSAAENDVSLVIVHFPVSGAPLPTVSGPQLIGQSSSLSLFRSISKSSPAYQQAQNVASFSFAKVTPSNFGKSFHIRGTVVSAVNASGLVKTPEPSVLLYFGSGGKTYILAALIPFPRQGYNPNFQSLKGREVIVTGLLDHSTGIVHLDVTSSSQVQVVR